MSEYSTKYICLLRGINVGGKNKLSMPELKTTLEQNNFTKVTTYINSGNIIFSHEAETSKRLEQTIYSLIKTHFDLDINVLIVPAKTYLDLLTNHLPSWWTKENDCKNNLVIFNNEVTETELLEEFSKTLPGEKAFIKDNFMFWSFPEKSNTAHRIRDKFFKSKFYTKSTARNLNTVLKLKELAELY